MNYENQKRHMMLVVDSLAETTQTIIKAESWCKIVGIVGDAQHAGKGIGPRDVEYAMRAAWSICLKPFVEKMFRVL